MTQVTPATCVLGPGKTGLAIGLRVLNLDGTEYSAFSVTGVAETSVLGTYRKAAGVVCPNAGGYIVWGTAVLDLAEATIDSGTINSVVGSVGSVAGDVAGKVLGGGAGTITGVGTSANVTYSAGVALTGRLAEVTDLPAAAPSAATIADAVLDEAKGAHTGWLTTLATTTNVSDATSKIKKWLQLLFRKDTAIVADNAIELAEINADMGTGIGDFDPIGESLEGLKVAIGSGGLTQQQVADAVSKLAPTAGAPAAGSVGAELDTIIAATTSIQAITDNIDVTDVTYVAESNAGHLTITIGRTFDQSVTALVIPADWEEAYFTIKQSVEDNEEQSIVQLMVSNPGDTDVDGLRRLNAILWHEAVTDDPETETDETSPEPFGQDLGALIVNQAGGSARIYLTDELTAQLSAAKRIGWDVKFIDSNGDSTGKRGIMDLVRTETQTV